MRIAMTAIVALALAMPGVAAQTAAPDTEGGRYIIRSLDDGVLRIDRETGAASLCREDADGWACRAVPDDREALEEEISRLASENAALARRIGELEERLADTGEAPPPAMEDDADLPTEAEIDRIMQTFETMMRRFLDMMRSLKDDFGEDRT
jgi:hypothetical protein